MTFDGDGVDMSFGFFVVPLLVSRAPDFPFATLPAYEWLINVILRERSVCVDVIQLTRIGSNGRWVVPFLCIVKSRNAICLF